MSGEIVKLPGYFETTYCRDCYTILCVPNSKVVQGVVVDSCPACKMKDDLAAAMGHFWTQKGQIERNHERIEKLEARKIWVSGPKDTTVELAEFGPSQPEPPLPPEDWKREDYVGVHGAKATGLLIMKEAKRQYSHTGRFLEVQNGWDVRHVNGRTEWYPEARLTHVAKGPNHEEGEK